MEIRPHRKHLITRVRRSLLSKLGDWKCETWHDHVETRYDVTTGISLAKTRDQRYPKLSAKIMLIASSKFVCCVSLLYLIDLFQNMLSLLSLDMLPGRF